jgi:hypothetical protein
MKKSIRTMILFAAPLYVGAVNLFHPVQPPHTEIYDTVHPVVGWWIALHVLNLFGFGLLGLAGYLLVLDRHGIAATLAKAAFIVYVPAYIGFDAVIGIGTGNLVRYAGALSIGQLVAFLPAIEAYWSNGTSTLLAAIGSLAWTVGVGAAGFSFVMERRGPAAAIAVAASIFTGWGASSGTLGTLPWWIGFGVLSVLSIAVVRPAVPYTLLILAGVLFGTTHVVPFGPLGMLCFIAAALSQWAGSEANLEELQAIRA